jgi:hypothetical protein
MGSRGFAMFAAGLGGWLLVSDIGPLLDIVRFGGAAWQPMLRVLGDLSLLILAGRVLKFQSRAASTV